MPDIAKLLLSNGADPDVRDMDGWTPLHHGCFNGNSMVVRALLQGGANLLIQGVGGQGTIDRFWPKIPIVPRSFFLVIVF